jgi:hypothetical protein
MKSQNSRNQGFFVFLLDDGRIRILEAQKQTDPTDPDPQRCLRVGYLLVNLRYSLLGIGQTQIRNLAFIHLR